MERVRTFSRRWGVCIAFWGWAGASWAANPAYDPPAGYYNSAAGLTRAGLKAALHEIIDDHVRYPYTSSSTDTWNILRDSDQDPNNPANVILVYNGVSLNGAQEYNGGSGWTREHVWPQSLGGFDTSTGPGTDCHNLKPCDDDINTGRSNLEFDNGGTPYTQNGLAQTYRDSNSFEPNPAFKGDVARIIFYMAVRYEGGGGEPDLELDDFTNGGIYTFGKLSTLLLWHALDPVDEFERRRNSRIAAYQGNRNPFIDRPEFAQAIWGTELLVPVITVAPVPTPLLQGQSLASSSLTGGAASVAGTFAWQNPSTVPTASGLQNVVFTPTQSSQYQTVSLAVSVTIQSLFQSWGSGYGLTGTSAEAGADLDGDGFVNLAEYALGGNPANAAGGLGPTVSTTNTHGTNWLRFAYRARTNDAALVIQPVFKASLTETNWSTNGVIQKVSGQPAGDGVHEDQVWQTPLGAEARRFLKLNISR